MRVLVCGGRNFANLPAMWVGLDLLNATGQVDHLIHGAARGTDTLAAAWAESRGIPATPFPADWSKGRGAGPARNARMLKEGRPDLVVAFPGGRGTADMVRRARAAGVKTVALGELDYRTA